MKKFGAIVLASLVLFSFHACKTGEGTAKQPADAQKSDTTAKADLPPDFDAYSNVIPDSMLADSNGDEPPMWASKKGKYNAERTLNFALKHTKLEVAFNWQKQELEGTAHLTVQPHFYPQDSVTLDAKGFAIHELQLVEKTGLKPLAFRYDSAQIHIALGRTYTRNEALTLRIRYTARPNQIKVKGSEAITSDKGLYFINPLGKEPFKPQQIWTQGETEANSCWFPTFDSPNVKTTQEMFITVDTAFVSLSNGKLMSSKRNANGTRTDYWRQDKPHAPYLFMMAIGKYAVVKDKWRNMEVSYYVEPKYAQYAKDIFGNTPEMLEFFSKKLNYPFPWDKYAQVVVRDYVSGAMENTSASVFMEQVQADRRELMDDNWDEIIAHELFHQWFGDLVTCESWANLPLNEAFATYSEYLWMEHKYGRAEADHHRMGETDSYFAEAESKREPLIRFQHLDKEEMFDSHSYAKGSLVLHMLRQQVGDEAFFAALHRYLKANEYKKVEIHQLRLAFEEVTGQDLNWFFNQWFLAAGHPELSVSDTTVNNTLELRIAQQQDSLYTPIYTLPLYVEVWEGNKKTRHHITLSERDHTFRFPVSQKPDLVLFDAEAQLLARIDHPKSVDNYIFQLRNSKQLPHQVEALRMLQEYLLSHEGAKKAALEALASDWWPVRQAAAELLGTYQGNDSTAIADRLKNLALNDERSLVRATAVNSLPGLGVPSSFFLNTLKDSSYTVIANSLYAYVNSGGEEAVTLTEPLETLDNLAIIRTLADFYAYFKVPNKLDWFMRKISSRPGGEMAYLFNYLGNYLMEQPTEDKQRGIAYLADFAFNHPDHNTRLGAYSGLVLLEQELGVGQLLKDIRKAERDVRVLQYYSIMSND